MWRRRKLLAPLTGARSTLATLAYAAAAGFLMGLTSIGSGSLILPLLMTVNRLPVVRAVGTDIFRAAIPVAFSSALHTSIGQVNWAVVPWLLGGLDSGSGARVPTGSAAAGMDDALSRVGSITAFGVQVALLISESNRNVLNPNHACRSEGARSSRTT
jgi:uncharacterized protein